MPAETVAAEETPPDPDADGLVSEVDACPCIAEDVDGFDDADGCPELDNDQDGMHDACDACPNEPETYRNADTREGCPDAGGSVGDSATLATLAANPYIYFLAQSSRIPSRELAVVDLAVRVLAENPRFLRLSVQGHAAGNERGADALSLARANAVRAAMVERGVDPARLLAVGLGSRQPQDPGTTRDAHARNRRVNFVVDQAASEEPDPSVIASVSDCDVPAPADHCAAVGSDGGG